ncbi:mechanosensitive ion channel-like protein [Alteromonadaceae bacterium 2753L.S.0a.02]|nr:mechanosensitive ion channel-like protein [Alteromonadaceae bacterium 2753L.S.0a.02]
MEFLAWLAPSLSQAEWWAHGTIFVVNILLLLLAKPFLNFITVGHASSKNTLRLFRSLNVVILVLHALDLALLRISDNYQHSFIKVGLSFAAIYTALLGYSLLCYLSRRRFGIEKTIDEKTIYLDTYSSRLIDIILLFVVVLATIYALIKIWGADSMLETTGIFGILAAFLAFTSSSWAPDIIGGLIILNTQMLEDGDVVIVEGFPDEYVISKVTLFYVVLYDVRNNHRTLIRNNRFVSSKIDNLSRVASNDGIRQRLVYKIGYPDFTKLEGEGKTKAIAGFNTRVDRMFNSAFEKCVQNKNVKINEVKPFEWAMTNAGDYALHYSLWVYLARIPNTKVTATIRKHLMGTLHQVNEAVYQASLSENISLATPVLNQVSIDPPEQQS